MTEGWIDYLVNSQVTPMKPEFRPHFHPTYEPLGAHGDFNDSAIAHIVKSLLQIG
ncbi:MAG: hypothetical protein Fur0046_07720 [Cyanobacteria bacterium J069]